MASSTSGSCVLSWRWPGVMTTESGLPLPSQERWTLLLRPPRLRPRASSGGCGSPFSGLLGWAVFWLHWRVGAPGRRCCLRLPPKDLALGVRLALDVGEQPIPGTVPAPSDEAVVASLPRTVAFGHVAPRSAGSQSPQDAVYYPAVIAPLFTPAAILGQKR